MKRKLFLFVAVSLFIFAIGCDLTGEDTAKVATETQKVAEQVSEVSSAVSKTPLTGEQVADIIAQVRAGNAATTPWNPYALPIDAGLGLVSIILALFLKKKTSQATLATKTLGSVVKAVETAGAATTASVKSGVAVNLAAADIATEGRSLIYSLK